VILISQKPTLPECPVSVSMICNGVSKETVTDNWTPSKFTKWILPLINKCFDVIEAYWARDVCLRYRRKFPKGFFSNTKQLVSLLRTLRKSRAYSQNWQHRRQEYSIPSIKLP
jgi:hypothetical protein